MAAELTLGLELETGAWSFWRTEERRRVRRGWPPDWTFQVGGPAVDCAHGGPEYSRGGRGPLTRLGCGQAGSRCRGAGAGRSRARPSFQVSLGPKAGWGAGGRWSADRAVPAREGQVRGAARGLTTLGSTRGPAGSWRCERRCGIARGRTSFAPTDGRPRGASAAVGGEPAKGLETRQDGDRSRTHCFARHAGRLGAGTARGGA